MTENEIAKIVVDASYHIHRRLGPGLLESVYEVVLAYLNQKADEYLAFVVNRVGEPLWYLNDRHLKEIVSYFDKNEHIAGLSIMVPYT